MGTGQVVMLADPFDIADAARRPPDVLDKGGHIFEGVRKVRPTSHRGLDPDTY